MQGLFGLWGKMGRASKSDFSEFFSLEGSREDLAGFVELGGIELRLGREMDEVERADARGGGNPGGVGGGGMSGEGAGRLVDQAVGGLGEAGNFSGRGGVAGVNAEGAGGEMLDSQRDAGGAMQRWSGGDAPGRRVQNGRVRGVGKFEPVDCRKAVPAGAVERGEAFAGLG